MVHAPQAPLLHLDRPAQFARQGFGRSLLLKLSYLVTVVGPATGNTVASSGPNSLAELPPKSFVVPGMKSPPSCHVQPSPVDRVEKNG